MPQIQAGELSVHTQLLGQGPPVIMLHGLLIGSLATWYFGVAPTVAKQHQVILYDLRGHGRSQKTPEGYDLATLSKDLDALMAALDVQPPIDLVGHSYGALIATRWAIDHPGSVRRLVLVDPPMPPSSLESVDALAAKSTDELMAILPGPMQRALRQGGRRSSRFLKGVGHLLNDTTMLDDLRTEPDFTSQELARLDCEVLAIFGERSPCFAVAERLRASIPKLTVQSLDAGHFLPMEAPDELSASVAGFLHG